MSIEIKLGERYSKVDEISRKGNHLVVKIDDKKYELDILMVEEGVYSILYNGKSFNIELIQGEDPKKYSINTLYKSFNAQVIDAESRYLMNREKSLLADGGDTISSPMPGKVVSIPVRVGDQVEAGDTLIIVSAMKMESEYKAPKKATVKEIRVEEGQTVNGNQVMVVIEP